MKANVLDEKYMPCQALVRASQGSTILLNETNTLCFGGRYHLGLKPPPLWRGEFLINEEKVFAPSALPVAHCREVKNTTLTYEIAPLHKFERQPDLVVIIGNPYQVMRLLGLAAYSLGNYDMCFSFCGTCAAAIEKPLRSNDVSISLIDATARRYSSFRPEEIVVSMPFPTFEEAMGNVEYSIHGTAKPEHKREFPD